MLNKLILTAAATAAAVALTALLTPSEAGAYGACRHVGYTHVGPNGVYHAGATEVAGGGGGGGYHAEYGGAYHAGGAAYGGAYHTGGAAYGGYHYDTRYSGGGGAAVGGYHYDYVR